MLGYERCTCGAFQQSKREHGLDMRLICPKCTAAYDIPAKAIPLDGREVQCSSCTHTWYQLPPGESKAEAPLTLQAAPKEKPAPPAESASGLTPIHMQEREAERISKQIERLRGALSQEPPLPHQHAAKQRQDKPETRSTEDARAPWAKEDGPPPPPRRKIDPQVLEVLRAEAVRETRARKADPTPLMDAQPDLGLRPPPKRPTRKTEGIREKLARLQAAERGIDHPTPWVRGEQEQAGAKKTEDPAPSVIKPEPTARTQPDAASAPSQTDQPALEPAPEVKPASEATQQPQRTNVVVRKKSGAGLPVALSSRELALIVEKQERVRFRWGFGATAGVCCLALVVYLGAAPLARSLPNEQHILELVVEKGAVVQSKLATGVRAVIAALSADDSAEG